MLDTIKNRHVEKIERADTIKAGDVDSVLMLIGSPLVVRVNPAAGAEKMLRRLRIEAIEREYICTLQNLDAAHLHRNCDGAPHATIRTGASADGVEAVAERRLKANGAAMALAGSYF